MTKGKGLCVPSDLRGHSFLLSSLPILGGMLGVWVGWKGQ